MKATVLLSVLVLLFGGAVKASPNIMCQYFLSGGRWHTFPTFTPGLDSHNGNVGTLGTINTSSSSGTDAVCSRIVSQESGGHNLIQQVAYEIDPADQQTPPDAGTCAFRGTKPFKLISSKQIKTNQGSAHAVTTPSLQLIDYTPTPNQIAQWRNESEDAATDAMTKKCLKLVTGSLPVTASAARELPTSDLR